MPDFTWIIVLLIIGFIGSLSKRYIRAGGKNETYKAPVFVEEDSGDPAHRMNQESLDRYDEGQSGMEIVPTERNDIWKKSEIRGDRRNGGGRSHRKSKREASPNQIDYTHLTKKQLREGFIIGEILNEKPRSKDPHPTVKRYARRG
ncbi:MAG TPA: hypothetical protein VFK27_02305 [Bacillales bacterium]|nr:hypothetical protein [Bacillales bacterium]